MTQKKVLYRSVHFIKCELFIERIHFQHVRTFTLYSSFLYVRYSVCAVGVVQWKKACVPCTLCCTNCWQ